MSVRCHLPTTRRFARSSCARDSCSFFFTIRLFSDICTQQHRHIISRPKTISTPSSVDTAHGLGHVIVHFCVIWQSAVLQTYLLVANGVVSMCAATCGIQACVSRCTPPSSGDFLSPGYVCAARMMQIGHQLHPGGQFVKDLIARQHEHVHFLQRCEQQLVSSTWVQHQKRLIMQRQWLRSILRDSLASSL